MRNLTFGLLGISLTACLEAQPAPDILKIPMSDFNVESLVEGLKHPWAVAEYNEGFYITERIGQLFYVSAGGRQEIKGLSLIHI